jgi:hypothetical protein
LAEALFFYGCSHITVLCLELYFSA